MKNKDRLVNSLRLLSMDPSGFPDFFEDFVDIPFEVLDSFRNSFLLLPEIIENENLGKNVISNLIRISIFVNFIIGSENFCKSEERELYSKEYWIKIRDLSRMVLNDMGEEIAPPDPKFL